MSRKKQIFFLISSLFFIASPFWLPPVQQFSGQHFFLTSRALSFLGLALLAGLASAYLLSDFSIALINDCAKKIKTHFGLITFVFLASLLAALIFIGRYVLGSFHSSGDEHSCYFLAECIRQGRLWATTHPLQEFFEVVHVGSRDGKWFSVYPPGWPLLFALGLQLNVSAWINPVLALISIFLLFKSGKKIFGFSTAALSLGLMAITPFFLFNSASYFSHTTCLAAVALFLYAYLRWTETPTVLWAAVCAFAIGYGLNTRYLTMAAITAPVLGYELLCLIKRKIRWTKSHFIFGVVLIAGLGFVFYYNYLITGNSLEAPNHYYHRWERLGFHGNYTPIDAFTFMLYRLFFLIDWSPPLFLFCYFLALVKEKGMGMRPYLIRCGFWYPVFAYVFYYSWGGNQYGPRYYFEGIPFLFFAAGAFLHKHWSNGNQWMKKFLIGILAASVIGNAFLLIHHGRFYRTVSHERKALYNLAEKTVQRPAVVFIRGFLGNALIMSEEDTVRNAPELTGKILYAHDLKEKNKELMAYYPDRHFYLGYYDRKANQPKLDLVKEVKP